MAVKRCYRGANSSPNKKSIFVLGTPILSLFVVAYFVAGASAADTEVSCQNVRSTFESKGMLSAVDVLEQPNSDAGGLCLNRGCCGSSASAMLSQHARTQLETSLRTELIKLAEVLAYRAKKFDEFFRKLLQQSREDFHAMFKRTYGMIYEQHSYVFEELFVHLESYYTRGDTDLDNMMENFFGILYQKMFTVLNSQYSFDDKYLKCVNEHMRETQPFDDVPKKLSVQLRRAFVATRTFHKALKAGSDVVRNMLQVGVTSECITSWTRLRYCGACGGMKPPACSRYCHNVLRGCLPAHADLAQHWDAYVDAVEKVADRLIGPFNIVMVVEPIDIKISEAIMNFQEHNQEISQKIFQGCGKPVLGSGSAAGPFFAPDRTKRFVRSPPDFDWNAGANDVDDFEIETSFESVLKEDPSLTSLSSAEDMRATAKKMAEQSEHRAQFLEYMRGDMEAEEYEEHERVRRDADPAPAHDIDYRSYEFEGKRAGGKRGKKPIAAVKDDGGHDVRDWGSPTLVKLVRETRSRVRSSRRYWAHLPYLLCNEEGLAAPPAPNAPCFNGSHVASYTLPAAGEGSAALASNPEVRGVVGGAATLSTQQDALKTLTAKLKDAYNGVEVQWTDKDDLQVSPADVLPGGGGGGGAGSGSGSGDDSDSGWPDDDEDGNTPTDYEGSGAGRPDDEESQPAPPAPESPAPATEVPFTPVVLTGGGDARNVRLLGGEIDIDGPAADPRGDDLDERVPPPPPPPPRPAAAPPSLTRALFSYALPVVCAWFGTIVTDLI